MELTIDYIKANCEVTEDEGCWLWLQNTDRNGFARIKRKRFATSYVHRIAWELVHGSIDRATNVYHTCQNHSCCNPDHLRAAPPKGVRMSVASIKERCSVNPHTGCWEWQRACDCTGYGHLQINKKQWTPHRCMWTIIHGPLQHDQFVCHKCDNKKCCNPDHLFVGSVRDNALDASRKGILAFGERNTRAKLTAHAVDEIRRTMKNKTPTAAKELAARFGISLTHVHRIARGEGWQDRADMQAGVAKMFSE